MTRQSRRREPAPHKRLAELRDSRCSMATFSPPTTSAPTKAHQYRLGIEPRRAQARTRLLERSPGGSPSSLATFGAPPKPRMTSAALSIIVNATQNSEWRQCGYTGIDGVVLQ